MGLARQRRGAARGMVHGCLHHQLQGERVRASRLHQFYVSCERVFEPKPEGSLHGLYMGPGNKKPNLVGWAKCLILLVPAAGLEPATP